MFTLGTCPLFKVTFFRFSRKKKKVIVSEFDVSLSQANESEWRCVPVASDFWWYPQIRSLLGLQATTIRLKKLFSRLPKSTKIRG